MSKYKMLNVEVIFADFPPYNDIKEEVGRGSYGKRIPVVFGKPGVYQVDRKTHWVELDSEFAFEYKGDMFNYYLNKLSKNERPLTNEEYKAVDVLMRTNNKKVSKDLRELHYLYENTKEQLGTKLSHYSILYK